MNWSLERETWAALRSYCENNELSWSTVQFQRAMSASIPERPGMYLICAKPPVNFALTNPPLNTIIYVGKADTSIRKRFEHHLSQHAADRVKSARYTFVNNLSFKWTVINNPVELERLVYDSFRPPANSISPPTPRLVGVVSSNPRPIRTSRKSSEDR